MQLEIYFTGKTFMKDLKANGQAFYGRCVFFPLLC